MDLFFPFLAAGGIDAFILHIAERATGLKGGAQLTTALAGIGFYRSGMKGGLMTLGAIGLTTFTLSQKGIEMIFRGVIRELLRRGESSASLEAKIDNFPVSAALKNTLRVDVARFVTEGALHIK